MGKGAVVMASLFKLDETASWIASWVSEEGRCSWVSAAGNSRRFASTAAEQRLNYANYTTANRTPPPEYAASIALIEEAAAEAATRAEIEAQRHHVETEKRELAEQQYRDQVRQRHGRYR